MLQGIPDSSSTWGYHAEPSTIQPSAAASPQIIVEPLFVAGAIEMYIAAVAMNEYENELVIIL